MNGVKHAREWLASVALLLTVLLSLAGCASSFDKAVATGYGLNIVTRDMSTELLNDKRISSTTGEQIKAGNDKASAALWKAWQIRKTYPDSAKASVKKVLVDVNDMYKYLKEQEVK